MICVGMIVTNPHPGIGQGGAPSPWTLGIVVGSEVWGGRRVYAVRWADGSQQNGYYTEELEVVA